MALMTDQQRADLHAAMMREQSRHGTPVNMNKAQGRAVIDALDVYQDSITAAADAVIPNPPRDNMTNAQKRWFFACVVARTVFPME